MSPPIIVFGLEVLTGADAAAEVFVNGARVAAKPAGQAGVQSLAVQHEVLPGRNEALVLVGTAHIPPASGQLVPLPGAGEELWAVLRVQQDTVVETAEGWETTTEDLSSAVWRAADLAAEAAADPQAPRVTAPHRLLLTFDAPPTTTAPIWTRATPFAGDQARAAVLARLRDLGGMLARGEPEAFVAAMNARYEDMARAYPIGGTAAERRARDLRALRDNLSEPGFRLLPFDPATAQCRVYAGGRLIECRAPDGQPLLRGRTQAGETIYFTVGFSLLGGQLVAVR